MKEKTQEEMFMTLLQAESSETGQQKHAPYKKTLMNWLPSTLKTFALQVTLLREWKKKKKARD